MLPLLHDEDGEEVGVPVEVVGGGGARGVHQEVPGRGAGAKMEISVSEFSTVEKLPFPSSSVKFLRCEVQ